MTRVYIFCEGQTEETFVHVVLQEHMNRVGIFLTPIVVRTSQSQKGGVVSYEKLKRQIERKCKEDKKAYVTTLIDYYGLPNGFPSHTSSVPTILAVEQAFARDVNQPNFIANLILHEYEALILCDLEKFYRWFDAKKIEPLSGVIKDFATPEHINNDPNTAPSKRILKCLPNYNKPLHGSLIAEDIGLDVIRSKCPHFDGWLKKIETLGM